MEGDDEGENEYPHDAYTAVKVLTGTWNLGAAHRRRAASAAVAQPSRSASPARQATRHRPRR